MDILVREVNHYMNNKMLNFVVLALILSVMVINNLGELHTFKTIFNSVAIASLVFIGCERIYKYLKVNKKERV